MRAFPAFSTDAGLLVLRAGLGLSLMFNHGSSTLFGGPEVWEHLGGALSVFGVQAGHVGFGFGLAFVAFVCGGLLVLGLYARPALTVLGVVLTAVWLAPGEAFVTAPYLIDLAVVIAAMAIAGPGAFSFDARLREEPALRPAPMKAGFPQGSRGGSEPVRPRAGVLAQPVAESLAEAEPQRA